MPKNIYGHGPHGRFAARPGLERVQIIEGEQGATGTIIQGGLLTTTDYDPTIRGPEDIAIWDEMRMGDATVAALIAVITNSLMAAEKDILPYDDDPVHVEQAEFAKKVLFEDMCMTWTDYERQAWLYLPFGRMFFEKVWDIKRHDGMIGYEKIAPRMPHTIWQYDVELKKFPGLKGVIQQIYDGSEQREIPWENLVSFINQKEGDNWEGRSILRPARKSWYIKNKLYKIDAIGHERHGLGILKGRLPTEANKQDESEMAAILGKIRVKEGSHIIVRGDQEVEMLDMKSGSIRNPMESIREHNMQILLSGLASHLLLGSEGQSGSRALSKDRTDIFMLSLDSMLRVFLETNDLQVIKPLILANWPDETNFPYMHAGKLGSIPIADLVGIGQMAQAGVVTPSPSLEKFIRKEADIPELSEAEVEDDYEEVEPKPSHALEESDSLEVAGTMPMDEKDTPAMAKRTKQNVDAELERLLIKVDKLVS